MEPHKGADLFINKRFVTEAELEETRKRRQEEWEKVRKPEDPKECPEEEYDPRSLYERLQEQKEKKQEEYEEQFKFKNMIRGLDKDETDFLGEVSRKQALLEKQRMEEDMEEMQEYRSAQTKITTETEMKKEAEKKVTRKPDESKNKPSQAKLLAGAVKRRSSENTESTKKQKLNDEQESRNEIASCDQAENHSARNLVVHCPSAAVCIGILPGLGAYSESSDSDSSSDGEGTLASAGKIVSSVFRSTTFLEAP